MYILDYLVDFFSLYSYTSVFIILLLCGFGLPIPEDITLVSGGIIAGLGYADLNIMIAVGMLGILMGDSVVFLIGHYFSEKFLKIPLIRKSLTPKRFEKVQDYFKKYGNFILFMARFMPGLRMPIYFTAGSTHKVSFVKFFTIDLLAATISAPLWVYLGYYGAENRDWILEQIKNSQKILLLIVILLIVVFFIFKFLKKK